MSEPVPNVPVVNLGNLYISGLRMTYATATTFTVAQGQARDSMNIDDIVLALPPLNNGTPVTTAFTLNGAVSGAGGLDTGVLLASKLYYVYVISSSQNSKINLPPSPQESLAVPPFTTPDPTAPVVQGGYYVQANVLISLSATAPLLPYNFDSFRRIGAVSTDSSVHFVAFQQTGYGQNRTMWYDSGTLDATHIGLAIPSSATAASQTLATIGVLTTLIPQTALEVMIYGSLVANAAGDSLLLTPKGFVGPATGFRTNASGTVVGQVMRVPGNFNSTPLIEIDYATSSATATVAFTLPGYVDQL